MKTIDRIIKEYDLNQEKIADIFGYKNAVSYANATRRKHVEKAICRLEELFSKKYK